MPYFDNLKTKREIAGLSKAKLSALSGVDRGTISKAEKHHEVRADRLYPLLDALNESYFNKSGSVLDRDVEITSKSKFG